MILSLLILLIRFFLYFYTIIYNRMQKKNMLASIFVFFVGFASMAQSSTGVPPPPAPPIPPGLPIDGGIVVLFIVALCYGAYKAFKQSKPTV